MRLTCCYCGKTFTVKENNIGSRNRSIRLGLPIYCNRTCAGLGRRINETPQEKKSNKLWYDLFIRATKDENQRDFEYFKNAFYFQLENRLNPQKFINERKQNMESHLEYCRQPEYRKWKKTYDEQYRAKKDYGDWWEAAIALKNLDKEIDYRESKRQNKIYNKSTTKRKRAWQKQLKQTLRNSQQLT